MKIRSSRPLDFSLSYHLQGLSGRLSVVASCLVLQNYYSVHDGGAGGAGCGGVHSCETFCHFPSSLIHQQLCHWVTHPRSGSCGAYGWNLMVRLHH